MKRRMEMTFRSGDETFTVGIEVGGNCSPESASRLCIALGRKLETAVSEANGEIAHTRGPFTVPDEPASEQPDGTRWGE